MTLSQRMLLPLVAALLSAPAHAAFDPALFAGLKARSIGPAAVGGRITAIDAVNADPNHMVLGVATGGVWITQNGGLTWTPVFDDQPVASIGAVAINQGNPDIIWVGTGEANVRNSTSIGGGMFKSVDGGQTWQHIGLANSERIRRIALHPSRPEVAWVAALGTLWGPNQERGVYKTEDGGKTWRRVLFIDEDTGATEVRIDPSNPEKLFAAMWQFRRKPYRFDSGGPGSGLYVSHDGGETWTQRTAEDGLPAGELGRIAVSVSAADPERVYALVEAPQSALLRSDDGGRKWQKVNQEYNVADRPFYYTEIIADPQNPDRVYNMATFLRVSIDGGKTFETNPVIACCEPGNTIHIDSHAFWVNPLDPRHLVIGNDGGVAISHDRGETWRFVRNLPLAQFYHIRVDDELPYNVYGGLQDNGSWRGPSAVWVPAGIRNLHWQEVGFGDGFDTIPDPQNAMAGYVMSQGGFLMRYDLGRGEQRLIRPAPPDPDTVLRFNWNAGFAQDPFDPATIYYGSQFVHRSTDRGETWTVISADLTSNDPELQRYKDSGGITPDVTAAENHTTIISIAPSEREAGVLWIGTDDGRVHVTRDGGASWTRIDEQARGVPAGSWVPMISPSPHADGTAFVVFDDHRRSNMATYVYRVEDYGRRWQRLDTAAVSGYALSVLQDFVDPDLLFVGTEFGLWFSVDGGGQWTRFTAGVPTVSVMDMAIQRRETDLVLGTHGRSVYVIDDYSGLRDLDSGAFSQRLQVLSVTPGQQYAKNPTASTRFTGSGEFRGENEPYGVTVTFMASGTDLPHPDAERERERLIGLRRQATETPEDEEPKPPKVTVRVSDAGGEVLRTFTHPVHQGLNRLTWDMAANGARPAPTNKPPEPDADLPSGAEVPPGRYTLRLSLEDAEASVPVETLADPRSGMSAQDYAARFQAMLELRAMEQTLVEALERISTTRADLDTLSKLVGQRDRLAEAADESDLARQIKDIRKQLDEVEQRFRVPPETRGINFDDDKASTQLQMAGYYVGGSRGAPSATASVYVEQARISLEAAQRALQSFDQGPLADLRQAVEGAGIGLLRAGAPHGGSGG